MNVAVLIIVVMSLAGTAHAGDDSRAPTAHSDSNVLLKHPVIGGFVVGDGWFTELGICVPRRDDRLSFSMCILGDFGRQRDARIIGEAEAVGVSYRLTPAITLGVGGGIPFASFLGNGLACLRLSTESNRDRPTATVNSSSKSCGLTMPMELFPAASVGVRLPATLVLTGAVRYVVGAPAADGTRTPEGLAIGVSLGRGI